MNAAAESAAIGDAASCQHRDRDSVSDQRHEHHRVELANVAAAFATFSDHCVSAETYGMSAIAPQKRRQE